MTMAIASVCARIACFMSRMGDATSRPRPSRLNRNRRGATVAAVGRFFCGLSMRIRGEMIQNETNKKLSPKQARAVEAMMTEPTIRGAAEKAGIGHATIYRWLGDPAFVEALREVRSQAFERTMTLLAAAAEKAVEVLREILGDDEAAVRASAAIRIRAARCSLDGMLRAHALIETEERLRRIEEQMESILNHGVKKK